MILLKGKEYIVSVLKKESVQIIIIYSLSFLIPFLIQKPQFIIGSFVNFLLIYSATKYDLKKIFPIIFLPSIASLLNGVLFGPFTLSLIYVLPAIFLGNFLLMFSCRYFKGNVLGILFGVLIKVSLLYGYTYILYTNNILPEIFLYTMGYIQIITGIVGCIISTTRKFFENPTPLRTS